MLLRWYLAAKLHGIRLTDKSVQYEGSITLGREFMDAAGIAPYEAVQVVNLNTGDRLLTYAIPCERPGACILNGAAARKGEVGDPLIVMVFAQSDTPLEPRIVVVDENNRIARIERGPASRRQI